MTEDLIIAPDISISGPGKVESVILFSNRKLQDKGEWNLGLSRDSYTANLLAMMLCMERYGNGARFVLDSRTDAQVMIGDNALRQLREKGHWKYVIDLAKEWYDWTRLPMVFAVMVSKKKNASIIKAAKGIVRAKEWGMKHIPEIASASKPDFMGVKETERYIRNIDYSLDERHIESITRFMQVMQKHGYTDRVFGGRRLW
jgi:chorismate dehydratase